MNNYNEYVGKYFERDLGRDNGEAEIYKVESFDGKHFVTTKYELHLGFSKLELNYKLLTSFIDKDNFKEITQNEYETVEYLCIDPYVTEWNNKDEPRYYRILKSNNKLPIEMK